MATPLRGQAKIPLVLNVGDGVAIRARLGETRRMSTRIGVMGAGVMGSGIAQVLAIAGHEVTCRDVSDEALVAAREAEA